MVALSLVFLAAVMAVAVVIALLPWWTERIKVWVLGAQLAASAVLPFVVYNIFTPWQIWAVVLAPGALIALVRLVLTLRSMWAEPE
jgi:hypothetical protein